MAIKNRLEQPRSAIWFERNISGKWSQLPCFRNHHRFLSRKN